MFDFWKRFLARRNARPVVPFFSSWFPKNRERAAEIRAGAKPKFFDPWF